MHGDKLPLGSRLQAGILVTLGVFAVIGGVTYVGGLLVGWRSDLNLMTLMAICVGVLSVIFSGKSRPNLSAMSILLPLFLALMGFGLQLLAIRVFDASGSVGEVLTFFAGCAGLVWFGIRLNRFLSEQGHL